MSQHAGESQIGYERLSVHHSCPRSTRQYNLMQHCPPALPQATEPRSRTFQNMSQDLLIKSVPITSTRQETAGMFLKRHVLQSILFLAQSNPLFYYTGLCKSVQTSKLQAWNCMRRRAFGKSNNSVDAMVTTCNV